MRRARSFTLILLNLITLVCSAQITKDQINRYYDSALDIEAGEPERAMGMSDSIMKWSERINWGTGRGQAIMIRAFVHSTR